VFYCVFLAIFNIFCSRCKGSHWRWKNRILAISDSKKLWVFCGEISHELSYVFVNSVIFLKKWVHFLSGTEFIGQLTISSTAASSLFAECNYAKAVRCFFPTSKHCELFDDNNALLCIYAVTLLNKCRVHLK